MLVLRAQGALPPRCAAPRPDAGPPHADRPAPPSCAPAPTRRVVTYGSGVDARARGGRAGATADVEVIDLRTVWPLDADDGARLRRAHLARAACCRRRPASTRRGRPARSRSSRARRFERARRAACARSPPPDTPVPFAPELEDAYLPSVASRSRPRSRSSLPTEPSAVIPAPTPASVDRADRLALFRLRAAAAPRSRSGSSRCTGRAASRARSTRAAARRRSRPAPGSPSGRTTSCAPLNRELATHFARGVTVAHVFRNFLGRADRPDARPRRQHALRRARARRLPARLDARRPRAGDRRRGAGVQAPRRGRASR